MTAEPIPITARRAAEPEVPGYTLSELADATGVPERTIRFYRECGLVDAPQRAGRRAYYSEDQLPRLRLIAQLRERGLGLEAIGRLLDDPTAPSHGISQVLRVSDELRSPWIDDRATRMTASAVLRAFGVDEPSMLDVLEQYGLITRNPGTRVVTYTVSSIRTLEFAGRLVGAGVDAEVVLQGGRVMQDRLADLAHELVDMFAVYTGRGFGGDGSDESLRRAFTSMQPVALGAVQLFFAHAIEDALEEFVERGGLLEIRQRLSSHDRPTSSRDR